MEKLEFWFDDKKKPTPNTVGLLKSKGDFFAFRQLENKINISKKITSFFNHNHKWKKLQFISF